MTFVIVAQRKGEWQRLDQHPHSPWDPQPSLPDAIRAVAHVAVLPGVLPMGIVDEESGKLVWTNDEPIPSETGEQLGLFG